jgi:uncharacterized protein YqgC (DUF456 family)
MIKFLAKLALARAMGSRGGMAGGLAGGLAGAFRPKGVKGLIVQALLRRLRR